MLQSDHILGLIKTLPQVEQERVRLALHAAPVATSPKKRKKAVQLRFEHSSNANFKALVINERLKEGWKVKNTNLQAEKVC